MKTELTNDSFLNGKLNIRQSKSGYRFSIDAILLAAQVDLKPGDRVLDVGTGCGIISLILAYRNPDIQIFGIEIQRDLADLARMNISDNHMNDRIHVYTRDVKTITPELTSGPVDVVVCNPPHRRANSGRINPNQQQAISRHEIAMTIDDLINAADRMLVRGGRFYVIYPAERMVDIFNRMRSVKIEPKNLRLVHSKENTHAVRCLVEGVKGGRPGIKVASPMIIYNQNGTYTEMIKQIFN